MSMKLEVVLSEADVITGIAELLSSRGVNTAGKHISLKRKTARGTGDSSYQVTITDGTEPVPANEVPVSDDSLETPDPDPISDDI